MNEIVGDAFAAFSAEASAVPTVSLRAGNALDDYRTPPPFDPALDAITDDYLRRYSWGIGYLDAFSWRHYLPHLIEHAVRCHPTGSDITDALLQNLRPPDRGDRFAAMTVEQEAVVVRMLDLVAFSDASPHAAGAQVALEEWWAPGALYRPARASRERGSD